MVEVENAVRIVNIFTIVLLIIELITILAEIETPFSLLPFILIVTGFSMILQGSIKAAKRLLTGDDRKFIIVNGITWILGLIVIMVGISALPNPFFTIAFISNEKTLIVTTIIVALISTTLETIM